MKLSIFNFSCLVGTRSSPIWQNFWNGNTYPPRQPFRFNWFEDRCGVTANMINWARGNCPEELIKLGLK